MCFINFLQVFPPFKEQLLYYMKISKTRSMAYTENNIALTISFPDEINQT